jgi:uncharacterized protein YbjQ (UPF0145 family)
MENLFGLGLLFVLLIIGYTFGRRSEAKHYASIRRREKEMAHIPVIINEWKGTLKDSENFELVHGSVVIGSDYFKTFAAGIRQIFGGNVANFETLLDRARREAILRMKEQAVALQASKIINMRLETSSIGSSQKGKKGLPSVEVHAYATAVS